MNGTSNPPVVFSVKVIDVEAEGEVWKLKIARPPGSETRPQLHAGYLA
jgi:hypothetical protein